MTVKRLPKTPLSIGRIGVFYLVLFTALATAAGLVVHVSHTSTRRYTNISTTAIRQLNILSGIRKEADAAQLSTLRMIFNTEPGDVAQEQTIIWELPFIYARNWTDYARFISQTTNNGEADSLLYYREAVKRAREVLITLSDKGESHHDEAIEYYYEHQKPVFEKYGQLIARMTTTLNRRIYDQLADTNSFVAQSSHVVNGLLLLSFCVMVAGGVLIARHHRQLARVQAMLAHERSERHAEITRQTLAAQERERNELGKELHDNVNQLLSAARLNLTVAQEQATEGRATIARSIECLQQAVEEIRCLCRSLVAPVSANMALADAIRELVARTEPLIPDTRLQLDVQIASEDIIAKELKVTIFRILQEQLGNIIKHSGASDVCISLSDSPSALQLIVKDNGVGFDPSGKGKGIGLDNIVNRAEAYHGSAELQTAPGQGCTWIIQFPVAGSKTRQSRLYGFFSQAAAAM